MKLFELFVNKAPNKVFLAILLGTLAGLSFSLLVPLIISALDSDISPLQAMDESLVKVLGIEVANYTFAKFFLFICVFILIAKSCSQVLLIRVALSMTTELRASIYRRISAAPIRELEAVGSPRLVATLTTDVSRIVLGARLIPEILINAVTILGMLGFLVYLNTEVFWFTIQCIFFGALTYQIPLFIGGRYFGKARHNIDKLYTAIDGLIYGAKELKINRLKREAFYRDELTFYEQRVLRDEKTGHTIVRSAVNYGDMISFFAIGTIVFVFVNYHAISNGELIGVIMALLYITGPIGVLLDTFPQLNISRISIRKVEKLMAELSEEDIQTNDSLPINWQSLKLRNIFYRYNSDDDKFAVGPINLEIKKGEITFIVGGNGSGKSTLSKLITQHYLPESGQMYVGDTLIDDQNIEAVRQSMCAIYSDYHLFKKIHGVIDSDLEEKTLAHLEELGLAEKTSYIGGEFSTLSLSDGQKRRLALLIAYVEDKDLYLFDEWAADQDPAFKRVFYQKILQELKRKGKAVVVISHDDRYFDQADHLVMMDAGQVISSEYLATSRDPTSETETQGEATTHCS